jgi:gluconate 2-dehydrogenase alpha chain
LKRVQFLSEKVQEIGRAMGASKVWSGRGVGNGAPAGHHSGGTRMGSNPNDSVVNKYGQSWDSPNLFVVGSSTYPTIGAGFNTTLTLQALAYMTADALVNKYTKNPGQLL